MSPRNILTYLFGVIWWSTLCTSQVVQYDKFDYVVVGAGSSGCAVASRLSENNFATVLLLEAGRKPNFFSEIPITASRLKQGEDGLAWFYSTGNQTVGFKGSINETGLYTAGKILGGGSGINGMLYTRGSPVDYELWEKRGATGWGYEGVLPYYMKMEEFLVEGDEIDMGMHGTDGLVTINAPYETMLKQAYMEAGLEMGFNITDHSGETQTGVSGFQATTRGGFRCSTERAYLQPAYGRPNLKVLTGAYATRVEIDSNLVAKGVYFTMDNTSYFAEANREVILCAGTIRTPQLLMLSGIGPKRELDRFNIPVKKELPVGQSYQDHVAAFGPLFTVNVSVGLTSSEIEAMVIPDNISYPLTGIMSSPGMNEVLVFIKSDYEVVPGDYPDIEFTIGLFDYTEVFKENIRKYLEPYMDRYAFKIAVTNNHPVTTGNVTLKSADPFDPPQINYDFLSDPNGTDLNALTQGIKLAHKFGQANALKKYGAEPIPDPIPGCEIYDMESDDYYKCHAVLLTESWNHGTGSCKMGAPNDDTVVLDPSLKVRGVKNLRVIDASVMPTQLSGNIMGACIMIGEKGSDIIINEYTRSHNQTQPEQTAPMQAVPQPTEQTDPLSTDQTATEAAPQPPCKLAPDAAPNPTPQTAPQPTAQSAPQTAPQPTLPSAPSFNESIYGPKISDYLSSVVSIRSRFGSMFPRRRHGRRYFDHVFRGFYL